MRQQTLADEGFERYRKPTRLDQFLNEMEQITPWRGLCKVIEPFYPKAEGAGRPPAGLERVLRIHFLQHWFNLSDPAVEEAMYDSRAIRRFVGIDLGRQPGPADYDVFVVKSRVHFRRGFDETGYAPTIVIVEAPEPYVGTTSLDALPYEHVDLSTLYPFGVPKGRR